MPDIVEIVHADHVRINQLIKELGGTLAQTCAPDSVSEPDPLWAALAGLLWLHIDAVEEIAYRTPVSADHSAALAIVQGPGLIRSLIAARPALEIWQFAPTLWT